MGRASSSSLFEPGPLSDGWSRPEVPKPNGRQKHIPSQVS